jgi:hypothetical protein
MVKVKKDLTGCKFGRLTVIKQVEDYIDPQGNHRAQWLCQCDCGSEPFVIIGASLTKKNGTKSCGCLIKEFASIGKGNKYDIENYPYGVGWTSNTNKEFYFDLEDYDVIKRFTWYEKIKKNGYRELRAYDPDTQKKIRMHQLIMGSNYDHRERNTLDNRKEQLRLATQSQQDMNRGKQKNNTSGFIGVYWHKQTEKWAASININKKRVFLGIFDTKLEAIKTRLKAEALHYGEFAPQRHLFAEYKIIDGGGNF